MTKIERTEQKLGFDRIRSMAEALCSTDTAKRMVQSAPFSNSIEDVTEMLSLADEMRVITMLESGFPDSGYVDTTASLIQLEHDSYYLDIQAISKLRVA
ncbi:MAG TPA: endonuclease MutS2, partial [Rikenellaceae bacterium]|nr:endonuclease MutS2 [Rikenellaceae bacterium]